MLKLAVSSVAWEQEEEKDVADVLKKNSIKYIELTPTKIWSAKIKKDPSSISNKEIDQVKNFWSHYDITPIAMQSMLYLRPDLTVFDNSKKREETIDYLEKFIELSSRMNIGVMVFGSPKNRRVNGISIENAGKIAKEFFCRIGEKAKKSNVAFCIEPNPVAYNCDYIINAKEGSVLVRQVNNGGFGLHLDSAGMYLADDNLTDAIINNVDILKHVHISAPQLETVNSDSPVDYKSIIKALNKISYDRYISVEMKPGNVGDNAYKISQTIEFVNSINI